MATGDVVRLVVKQRLHGQNVFNVLHFRQRTSTESLTSLFSRFRDIWVANITNVQSHELVYDSVEMQVIRPELTDGRIFDLEGVTGDVVGESLPSYCAVVMPCKTGLGGRSNRGRQYIAGIPESHQEKSVLTDAAQALWTPAVAAIQAEWITSATRWEWGVWSRKRAAEIPPPSTVPFGTYSSVGWTRTLATMRSRKLGIGA